MASKSAKPPADPNAAALVPLDFFRADPITLRIAIENQNFDWDNFLRAAAAESILPGLAGQTRSLGLQSKLKKEISDLFAAAETLNGERNQIILTEALYATRLLNRINIRPVALKGLAFLLSGVYSQPAARYLVDIDLLIPSADMPRAVAQLKTSGYFENEALSFPQFHHHHPGIRRAGLPHIEIHNSIGIGLCNNLLPPPQMLARARPIKFDGADFLIPSPTDLATHLIVHSQFAHPYHERIFPPLRALVDLVQLQKRFPGEIEWQTIAKLFRTHHQTGTLLLHLKQAHDLLGLEIPEIDTDNLSPTFKLRYQRRLFLSHHPSARFLDPVYLLMSLFNRRRMDLLPRILTNPSTWPQAVRAISRPAFYRNLLG